jgi:Family of unknown function (DUF6064)
MALPFTVEEFLSVFERYNRAIGPAPLVAYVLGVAALALACRGGRGASRLVLGTLSAFWAFNGGGYHLAFFRTVNPVATAFGVAFLAEAALLAFAAARPEPLPFRFRLAPRQLAGLAFAAYALVAYPLLGMAAGHAYPRAPMFGVAPCPTTIFTFALLLLADARVPAWLYAVPFLWSLLGVSAAAQLGIREDYGLAVAGIVGTVLLATGRRRAPAAGRPAAGALRGS